MGKSKPQTTVQTSGVPEEAKPYLYGDRGILNRASALSEQPMNLPDYQVAGFTQPQLQAFQLAQRGIGGYMPALSEGFRATQGGIGAAGQAMGLVPSALRGYDPTTGYQGFMNPYLEEVVRQSEKDIGRQGAMQAQGIRSQAVGQGAFGGSRQAVAERELGRNIADQQARTSSSLRAQGFEQAQANAMNAFENQMLRGLQGAQTIGNLGQGLGSLGAQMGNLGELGQNLNIRDVGTLMDIGTMQQAQAQAGLDALRQNQYQRTMAPYQQLGFMSDIFQGMPIGQVQTTSAPGPNPVSQWGGLALSAYGLSRPKT